MFNYFPFKTLWPLGLSLYLFYKVIQLILIMLVGTDV